MEIKRPPKPFLFLAPSIILSLLIIFLAPFVRFIRPYLPFTNYLLGIDKPTSYLIMLGNDSEMRANGGFAGSYAKLVISKPSSLRDSYSNQPARSAFSTADAGGSNPSPLDRHASLAMTKFDLSFQDIYVPNGQLKGYVTPPAPIQEAFHHGTWQLANADWEPDFPTAAASLRWFFVKGGEINPDIIAILNLTTIKKVLDIVGSFPVPEFSATLTPDNLYLFLQGKAEVDFFPGSTQKKDALTAVGTALLQKIQTLSPVKKIKIAQILYRDLQNQNIVINSLNSNFQSLLESKNFAGKLTPGPTDTYLLVEANLGANKANAYITRHTTHTITPLQGQALEGTHLQGLALQAVHHEVTVKFANSSPESGPNPPFHYGGDYKAFLRFYLPISAQNIAITTSPSPSLRDSYSNQPARSAFSTADAGGSNPESLDRHSLGTRFAMTKFGLTEIGFWQTTPAGGQTTVSLSYDLPISPKDYSLTILKQHGLVSSPQTITLPAGPGPAGKTFSTSLENDYVFPF